MAERAMGWLISRNAKNEIRAKQILTLTSQVAELKAVSGTLKSYMEVMLNEVSPTQSEKVIETEEAKLKTAQQASLLKNNNWYTLLSSLGSSADLVSLISSPTSADEALQTLEQVQNPRAARYSEMLKASGQAQEDFNQARAILNKPPVDFTTSVDSKAAGVARRRAARETKDQEKVD